MNDVNIDFIWKSQFLAAFCLMQFVLALLLESRYDKHQFRYLLEAAWYPSIYWIINSLVALITLPKTLLEKRGAYATWKSPDRGKRTAKSKAKAHSPRRAPAASGASHIIDGNQNGFVRFLEKLFSCIVWSAVVVYIAYMLYGSYCLHHGLAPRALWLYDAGIVRETWKICTSIGQHVLLFIGMTVLWQIGAILLAKLTSKRYGKPAMTTVSDTAARFQLSEETVRQYQAAKFISLEHNIVPEDFGKGK